jgi:hydroxymethylglutaryl-CoA synthase
MANSKLVGITGYGAYIPRFRITIEEIARVWGTEAESIKSGLNVEEKAVPGLDEDTLTISVAAAKNALKRAQIKPEEIGAVFVGSESHPYVVKPTGTIVAEAIGASQQLFCADLEFACKAGTAGMQICFAMCKAGMIKYGLAIGADCAQGRPGDALEYTAAAGGAAFIIGSDPLAIIEETTSFATDTPDFFRREGQPYPTHAGRFTGEPAYFRHVMGATNSLLEKTKLKPADFDYVVFHMPNGKFPLKMAKEYGIPLEKMKQGLVVTKIGNTYSGSSPLGLTNVLDIAKPGQRILLTSYGSGAGADSFSFLVTEKIKERQKLAKLTSEYIKNKEYVDYGVYAKLKGKLLI